VFELVPHDEAEQNPAERSAGTRSGRSQGRGLGRVQSSCGEDRTAYFGCRPNGAGLKLPRGWQYAGSSRSQSNG
jgi:hypothetical protein